MFDRTSRLLATAAVGIGLALSLGAGTAWAETDSDASNADTSAAAPADAKQPAESSKEPAQTATPDDQPKKSKKPKKSKRAEQADAPAEAGPAEPDPDDASETPAPAETAQTAETAESAEPDASADAPADADGARHRVRRAKTPAPESQTDAADATAAAGSEPSQAEPAAAARTVADSGPAPVADTEPAPAAKIVALAVADNPETPEATATAPARNPVAQLVLTVLSWLGWTPRSETAAAFPAVPTPWAVVAWLRDAHPWYNRPPTATVVTGPPDPDGDTALGQVTATDADGDGLSYAVSRAARYGTVTLDAVTGHFTYVPTDPAAQADSFAVAVDDGHRAGTTVVMVTVDLTDVPTARQVQVTTGRSTLTLPCGDGCTVRANWYFPDSDEEPNGVIWLQHGFIAGGGWYDELATALAAQTNSVVVAPTLSSNPLTSGGKWLNGDVMQQAVADLLADRGALDASAAAAGYAGVLPQHIVLTGHSAGGGLVATVAGKSVDNGAIADILGVVMFDGVPVDDAVTAAVAKLTGADDRPVYQIAAHPYIWNSNGAGTAQLVAARPDRFVGVLLAGGSHIDSMQASDPLIALAGNLFAGYARAENQLAVQTLAVGWINDLYFGTADGVYGSGGETLRIGDATAEVLGTAVLPAAVTAVIAA